MKQLVLFVLLGMSVYMNAQPVKSGLIVEGGFVNTKSEYQPDNYGNFTIPDSKFGAALGYRFRILPDKKPFFYDLDVRIGAKTYNNSYFLSENNPYAPGPYFGEENGTYCHTSVGGTFNYKLVKGLSAGLGIEPTFYFAKTTDQYGLVYFRNDFDFPLVGKIAYDFEFIEIGLLYKHGLCTISDTPNNKKKFRDWTISLFIPF